MSSQDDDEAELQEVLAHAEQPLPSLTPYRKTSNRAATLRHSWSQPMSVSRAHASPELALVVLTSLRLLCRTSSNCDQRTNSHAQTAVLLRTVCMTRMLTCNLSCAAQQSGK